MFVYLPPSVAGRPSIHTTPASCRNPDRRVPGRARHGGSPATAAEIPYTAIGANTTRVFVLPTALGIEHRIVNGRVYITAIPVTDPSPD
jgi:hypothetical protein